VDDRHVPPPVRDASDGPLSPAFSTSKFSLLFLPLCTPASHRSSDQNVPPLRPLVYHPLLLSLSLSLSLSLTHSLSSLQSQLPIRGPLSSPLDLLLSGAARERAKASSPSKHCAALHCTTLHYTVPSHNALYFDTALHSQNVISLSPSLSVRTHPTSFLLLPLLRTPR
jgi:hypothetical protein